MANNTKYLSQITLLDGTIVYIKDREVREAIKGGTHYRGITTTVLEDGDTTNPVTINGESYTAFNGDIVIYLNKEFIFDEASSAWHELGDLTNLGALALKDTASGLYTPAGTVTFTGGTVQSTGLYTPSGNVSKPAVDVTVSGAVVNVIDQSGSVTAGTAASFNTTYDQNTENLSLSFTPNTPTSVTLPTSTTASVLTNVSAELHEAPTFTGSEASISVEGTAAGSAAFVGTTATITVE